MCEALLQKVDQLVGKIGKINEKVLFPPQRVKFLLADAALPVKDGIDVIV